MTSDLRIERGVCHALFAYDVGLAINLNQVERRLSESMQRETIHHKRRAPRVLEFDPPPLRVTQSAPAVAIGPLHCELSVDALLYDFGAISVAYAIPLAGPLADLLALSDALYENKTLLEDSRRRVEALVTAAGEAVTRPHVPTLVEDYAIYQVEAWTQNAACNPTTDSTAVSSGSRIDDLIRVHARTLAQILRGETTSLSAQEVADALASRISYGTDDATIIDWNAAIVFDREPEDVRTVLEFANVELLEMRVLDAHLDQGLAASYEVVSRRRLGILRAIGSSASELRRIAQLQADNALLFEGVNNTLKLIGDQYLAKVYRLASQRLHLAEWDAGILRKLATLESIYQKLADQQSHRRSEVLEWIIIGLIMFEIVMSLFPQFFRH